MYITLTEAGKELCVATRDRNDYVGTGYGRVLSLLPLIDVDGPKYAQFNEEPRYYPTEADSFEVELAEQLGLIEVHEKSKFGDNLQLNVGFCVAGFGPADGGHLLRQLTLKLEEIDTLGVLMAELLDNNNGEVLATHE